MSVTRIEPKNLEQFDKIVKSYPINWVMVTDSLAIEKPPGFYSVRVFFKNDVHDCVDSPTDLSAEYIAKTFGKHIERERFDFFRKAFPDLIDDKLVEEKHAWDKKRKDEYKSAFISKMEAKIPMQSISKVKLGSSCFQTYPCQHHVSFYQKGNNKKPKHTEQYFLSAYTAEHYADFLNASDFMHIREYMDEETKERLTDKKLASILNQNVEFAKLQTSTYHTLSAEGFIPHVEISGLSISYINSNKSKYISIKDPADVARYFGKYLDVASMQEISNYMSSEIYMSWLERTDEMVMKKISLAEKLQSLPSHKPAHTDFYSTKYSAGLFSSNPAKRPDLDVTVTDDAMAKSAFGQSSNTAKRLHK